LKDEILQQAEAIENARREARDRDVRIGQYRLRIADADKDAQYLKQSTYRLRKGNETLHETLHRQQANMMNEMAANTGEIGKLRRRTQPREDNRSHHVLFNADTEADVYSEGEYDADDDDYMVSHSRRRARGSTQTTTIALRSTRGRLGSHRGHESTTASVTRHKSRTKASGLHLVMSEMRLGK
jgi:hypothetical protein